MKFENVSLSLANALTCESKGDICHAELVFSAERVVAQIRISHGAKYQHVNCVLYHY